MQIKNNKTEQKKSARKCLNITGAGVEKV